MRNEWNRMNFTEIISVPADFFCFDLGGAKERQPSERAQL